MTQTIKISNGFITLAESKAVCPHCERQIPFDEIEEKYMKKPDRHYLRMKCLCKRFIGIAVDYKGDYVAFEFSRP